MSETRKYTVAEIDAMRRAIETGYSPGVVYDGKERAADVENRLRTYMQNGTDPAELFAHISHQNYLMNEAAMKAQRVTRPA